MDQVPLPLVIGLGDTWDTKGNHRPVCLTQTVAGSGFFCFVKLCFRQRVIQPNIAVIWQVTVRGIADFDKQSYKDVVLLLWKISLWENRRVFLGWTKTHTLQISGYHHTKEYGSKEELLIFQDNLDDQVQKKCQDMCQEVDNTLCWYYHHEYKY